ncbi:MAG: DegT/DnrJ/EryC1/StrS family aminotransferase [Elusimicrobia bacterium]|nr:DegT/DnrJ/EryC1/StrS family aminotransferase [Elusimicrobiota bacterium]
MPGYELFGSEERHAVESLFEANNGVLFAHGFVKQRKGVYKVREFEAALAAVAGSPHCQVVSSGTAALLVALRALGVGPGDEVITSSFTFVATVEAILEAGAVPVLTEVDDTYNMDPEDMRSKITRRTKAVLPVHMAGAPARMDEILKIASDNGLLVLEDAAQAFGGTYKGRFLGTLGDAGVYSFDFAKNITTGEGGAVVCRSREVFERARELHDHGHQYNPSVPRGKDTRRFPGFNFRMTEIQAAIGLAQLRKLEAILGAQRANRDSLLEKLSGLPVQFRVVADAGEIADTVIFAMPSRERALEAVARLSEKGVGTKNLPDAVDWHFAGTWGHLFAGVPSLRNCSGLWPRTRELLERSIALPVNAVFPEAEIRRTAEAVREVLSPTEVAR